MGRTARPIRHPTYGQLDEIIFTDCTSSRRLAAAFAAMLPVVPVAADVPAVVVAPPAVVDVPDPVGVLLAGGLADVPALETIVPARPVTWILWPTCLSRSFPPESIHVAAAPLCMALLPPVGDDPVAVVDVPPLVVVAPPDDVVLAPLAVVAAAPVVLVLAALGSIFAFVSM